jgi:hypothetical protein
MPRDPKDLWNDLLAEAGESEIDEAASVSVEQAERELAAAGFDVKAERANAAAFLDELEGKPAQPPASAPAAAPRRRRPRPAVLWLAAAATATATGGLLYAALHNPTPAPSPAPSSPPTTPSTSPTPSTPPLIASASPTDLRLQARAALDAGRPVDCLSLLEQARALDPAGDAAPDVTKLRAAAVRAMKP